MLPRRPAGIIRSPIDVDHRLDGRGLVELDRGSHSSSPVGTRMGTRLATALINGRACGSSEPADMRNRLALRRPSRRGNKSRA